MEESCGDKPKILSRYLSGAQSETEQSLSQDRFSAASKHREFRCVKTPKIRTASTQNQIT